MTTQLTFTFDHTIPDALIKKGEKAPKEFLEKTNQILGHIQSEVQFYIPWGQHCPGQGKGGTTKSAIKKTVTSVGGRVYADEHTAPWFKWFEDGRGPVRVKKAKALHFCVQGKHIFRKSTGPSKGAESFKHGAKTSEPKVKRDAEKLGEWLSEL